MKTPDQSTSSQGQLTLKQVIDQGLVLRNVLQADLQQLITDNQGQACTPLQYALQKCKQNDATHNRMGTIIILVEETAKLSDATALLTTPFKLDPSDEKSTTTTPVHALIELTKKSILHNTKAVQAIFKLIPQPVPPNIQDGAGCTLLHTMLHAVPWEQSIVENLLKANADITIRDNNNRTPLHVMPQGGALELLLKKAAEKGEKDRKAYINAVDSNNSTALHNYAHRIVSLLGNNENAHEDPHNQEAINDRIKYMRLLVENGADISIKDKDGKTAFDILPQGVQRRADVQLLLQPVEAKVTAPQPATTLSTASTAPAPAPTTTTTTTTQPSQPLPTEQARLAQQDDDRIEPTPIDRDTNLAPPPQPSVFRSVAQGFTSWVDRVKPSGHGSASMFQQIFAEASKGLDSDSSFVMKFETNVEAACTLILEKTGLPSNDAFNTAQTMTGAVQGTLLSRPDITDPLKQYAKDAFTAFGNLGPNARTTFTNDINRIADKYETQHAMFNNMTFRAYDKMDEMLTRVSTKNIVTKAETDELIASKKGYIEILEAYSKQLGIDNTQSQDYKKNLKSHIATCKMQLAAVEAMCSESYIHAERTAGAAVGLLTGIAVPGTAAGIILLTNSQAAEIAMQAFQDIAHGSFTKLHEGLAAGNPILLLTVIGIGLGLVGMVAGIMSAAETASHIKDRPKALEYFKKAVEAEVAKPARQQTAHIEHS